MVQTRGSPSLPLKRGLSCLSARACAALLYPACPGVVLYLGRRRWRLLHVPVLCCWVGGPGVSGEGGQDLGLVGLDGAAVEPCGFAPAGRVAVGTR